MQKRLQLVFEKIEATPLTLGSWFIALLAIIAVRIAIEFFFENIPFFYADHYLYKFSHFFFTFSFTYLAALPLIAWFARVPIRHAATILLFGFLIIWTPPIIDEVMSNGAGLWSFYAFDSISGLFTRYLTFFGDRPDVGITYGVRTEVALVLCLATLYVWTKTRNLFRTLFATLSLYTVLFLIGALPSLVTFFLLGPTEGFLALTELDVARFMLSPEPLYGINPPSVAVVLAVKMGLAYSFLLLLLVLGIMFFFFRTALVALSNNLRLPQVVYHCGLFLMGAGLVFIYEEKTVFIFDWIHLAGLFMMLFAVVLSWFTSVIVNDLNDVRIDTLTNPDRPLITHTIDPHTYATIGILSFAFLLLLAGFISTQLAILLTLYQALAWVYSVPPLRLKRFPILATLLAAGASVLVFLGGYVVFSATKNAAALPWSIPTLLFIAYTFLLPIKDFKDIPGDRADGVFTLPIVLGEKRAKQLIGGMLLIMFIVSVFVFDVPQLFLLAFFFGSLAYWLLQVSSKDHKYFNYHHLAHWYIALISAYVFFLILQFWSK